MEGYNSDEDDEEEDTSKSQQLIRGDTKDSIQELDKLNSFAEKVDIFDGRLE